jgi:hypothetical protein
MKNLIQSLTACAAVGAAMQLNAQIVTVDPSQLTLGYMNWSPAPGDAAGYGGSGSSSWGPADLRSSFSGNTVTLSPNINTYDPTMPYWVNADGSGANIMDANLYSETTGTYVDTTLTFRFDVLGDTLSGPYTAGAFIRDFAPDYSSFTQSFVTLTPGVDSISLLTSANPGDHVQYGFDLDGPDTSPTSAAAQEYVEIAPAAAPELSSLSSSLILCGLVMMGVRLCRFSRVS